MKSANGASMLGVFDSADLLQSFVLYSIKVAGNQPEIQSSQICGLQTCELRFSSL